MPEKLRILAADLSLRCPGFALQDYNDGRVSIARLCHLNNRDKKLTHGEILATIYELMIELSAEADVFVREKGFSRFAHETQTISKVVGIADLTAWQQCQAVYHELAPAAIKKWLTGSGKASKAMVASCLEKFVGRQIYTTNDESDAVAVGIAWLLQNSLLTRRTRKEDTYAEKTDYGSNEKP